MSDKTTNQQLGLIAYQLKELVKVQAALNENIVSLARDFKTFVSNFDTVSVVDGDQMVFGDMATGGKQTNDDAPEGGMSGFYPNQIVYIPSQDCIGKVCGVGVDGGLLKIEVELDGSEQKLLFAPYELRTDSPDGS